ncbi:Zinc finger C2H2-type, partial [Trinorchestia longiramus]
LQSFSSSNSSETQYPSSAPPAYDPSKSVVNCPQCDDKLLDGRSLEVHLIYRHGLFSSFQAATTMNSTVPKTGDQQCGQVQPGDHGSTLTSDTNNHQHVSPDHLEFGSVLTNVDSLHMSNSNSQSHLVPSSAMSPMQFDFSSTMMHNVSGSFQPTSSQYLNDIGYPLLQSTNEYGLSQSYSSLSNYGRPNGYSTDEVDYQSGYDRQYSAPLSRFHPYGRSPLPSPSVIKEEPIIKSETQEILDLDSHRFLQNSTHTTAVPQLSGGTMSQLWRPAEQQLSNSPTLPPMPLTGGHMQSMSLSPMFGGPAMHSQNNASQGPMGGVSHGYHSPVPSNSYHPQGFSQPQSSLPSLGLPKPSPNYMTADSSQSSSILQTQPPTSQSRPSNDRPPTEFPTNVKRPKNFKCDVCLKWFTSQGHLKRHYNTTLHKNMEKQKENDKSAELGKPQNMQNAAMQSSILQPAMSPAMSSAMSSAMAPAMSPAMSPAMPSAMAPAISPAMPSAMPSSVSPAMPSTISPVIASSLSSSDTLLMPSSPRLSNGMTIQPGPDSSSHLMSETDEKTSGVNPSPLSYQISNDIQYSETPEQNIQYHPTYGSNPSYESSYNDYSHRSVGLDAYPSSSSNNSTNHVATSSTIYQGNFSSMDMISSSGYPTQFFQSGPTPMVGGGRTFIRPNDSSIRPSPSPHHQHLQSHSGRYNMTSSVSHPSEFPGANTDSTNGHLSQMNADVMGQNRPLHRYSPQDNMIGDFGEKVESMINGFTSITSLHSMDSRDPSKRQELADHYFAEPDGRPPSISPETRIGSALDSTSDGSRDSISTTASGGSTSSTTPTPKSKDSKEGSVKCLDCDKVCSSICYLTQHRKRYHSGVLDFKCEKCGKKFSERTIYEEHKLKHAGEKPYKCDECPKQFNHKTDLRRHSCLHTGEKPFHCPTCGKGFIRKDHMMKHQNTHEKKRQAAAAAAAVNTIPSPHLPISMNGGLPVYPSPHIPSNPLIPDHFVSNQYPTMNHHHHHPHIPPPPHHNPPPPPHH